MAKIYRFRRHKKRLAKKEKNPLPLRERARELFKKLGRLVKQSYTLVFVYHTEKKFRNFHISFLFLCGLFLFQLALVALSVRHLVFASGIQRTLTARETDLHAVQRELDKIRGESAELFQDLINFEQSLSGSRSILSQNAGFTGPMPEGYAQTGLKKNTLPAGRIQDDTGQLRDYLGSVLGQAFEIRGFLDYQQTILREIPSIWPVKGGVGRITSPFGPGIHPYTGQPYLHRGIDIATHRQGDPVVAAADGQVVTTEYDQRGGFGNYIVIRHKHGYYTRYGHLLSFAVPSGRQVQQGEVIGHIGNTGLSTGPHLHYEIHIGPDVADPQKFIRLRQRENLAESIWP
jgi:murein DD-endopeptidase MepM/ murein hydrolase activator NlpD